MYNGILICNKPAGFTSHDVIAKLRGVLGQRQIGYAGTLDPFAVGVLPLFLGNATKAAEFASDSDKEYIADVRFGLVTDTLDISGKILSQKDTTVSKEQLESVLPEFRGCITQIPPMYSAISVNGTRLYKLARQGISVDIPPRNVNIKTLEIISQTGNAEYKLRVECSKGTYIRSLCRDIGNSLGCGATVTALQRVRACGFNIENSYTIEEISKAKDSGIPESLILPTDCLFDGYPEISVNENGEKRVKNGCYLMRKDLIQNIPENGVICRVYGTDGKFLMLGAAAYEKFRFPAVIPYKMFL